MPLKMKVSEVMRPVSEFPQIPYWYTVREAIMMLKAVNAERARRFEPTVVLVMDEQYQLMGHVRLRDLLRGLVPAGVEGQEEPWRAIFTEEGRLAAEREVAKVLRPLATPLAPEDPVAKAAYYMAKEGVNVIPVAAAGKPVGIVRLADIFEAIVAASLLQRSQSAASGG